MPAAASSDHYEDPSVSKYWHTSLVAGIHRIPAKGTKDSSFPLKLGQQQLGPAIIPRNGRDLIINLWIHNISAELEVRPKPKPHLHKRDNRQLVREKPKQGSN
ncbi:hypothetical protein AMTR_s00047p00224810 [Amborella trichopoda]|uniref:Uncharacterized protein n=1 Tax=Amborella trichopoda TaxID=13333 RepID=U5D8Z3_AMBTC|nr:hypothetical protein AMTR_s00047p00224810 [Amborella trichopoda]